MTDGAGTTCRKRVRLRCRRVDRVARSIVDGRLLALPRPIASSGELKPSKR